MARARLIPFGLLLCSALAFAWSVPPVVSAWEGSDDGWADPDDSDDGDHGGDHEPTTPDGAAHVREKLATKFDVDAHVISKLRDRGLGYGEIDHALTLAERMPDGVTRENVKHVLELRQDQHMGWGQVAHELDTTLGAAKREFPTNPPPADGSGMQPTSLSRPGKSAFAAGHSTSAGRQVGRSFSSSGSKSAGRMSGASAGRSGGHAFGRASSGASGAKSNGKAKGRK